MNIDLSVLVLACLQLLVIVLPSYAQTNDTSGCHSLATQYDSLISQWQWQDVDTVFFSVSSGDAPDALTPNPRIVWYQYETSSDQLIELKSNPYQDLTKTSLSESAESLVQPDVQGSFESVSVSPTGTSVVYPTLETQTNEQNYHFVDTQTGLQIDLGPALANISPMTFWTTDQQRFVVQGESVSNALVPIRVVTLKKGKAVVQDLLDLPTLGDYAEVLNIKAKGISPDGQYLLIQVDTERVAWLYAFNKATITPLPFAVFGDRAIWLDATTFVAATNLGVVQYDIASQKTEIRANLSIGPTGSTLSPDGRFIIDTRLVAGTNDTEFVVCRVG